ncbi:hypothetical protein BLA47_09010 [Yersinia pseudotuberculosis]|nr:hypothetical protein BLA47_09010 [Yersinia pseudotuberculosis]
MISNHLKTGYIPIIRSSKIIIDNMLFYRDIHGGMVYENILMQYVDIAKTTLEL